MNETWVPDVDDLTVNARNVLKAAYDSRRIRRPRCSLEDFAAGYIAAVLELRAWGKFQPEARERLHPTPLGIR